MDKGKNKLQRVINFIPKLAICVFGIYLTANFLFLVFLLPNWQHQLMKEFVQYNPIFFIVSLFIGLAAVIINLKLKKINEWLKKINLRKFILIGAIILLAFQLIIFFGKIFVAGWDVQKLFFATEFDDLYFSQYPNNLFLKTFYGLFSKLFLITGLSKIFMSAALSIFPWSNIANALTEQNAAEYVTYFFFVFINCVIINISVALTALITNKLLNKKTAALVYIFTFIFIGLNLWILVPYSDTLTLFNTTLILYIYVCAKKKHFKWPLIFSVAIIGFNIKPTTIFCLIAIIFIEICKWISRGSYKKNFNFKKITMQTGSIILACLLCFAFVNICKNTNNINIDENKEYTSTHFLMMGSNISSGGFYSDEDIQISSNCKSVKEREQKKSKHSVSALITWVSQEQLHIMD